MPLVDPTLRWHLRAEGYRAIRDSLRDVATCRAYEQLAATCERMAGDARIDPASLNAMPRPRPTRAIAPPRG